MVDCLKCINSACCKLEVSVNRTEYEHFKKLNLHEHFETRTENFLNKNEKYIKHKKYFDEMYEDDFAILKQKNGYCSLLDQETMLCTIYEDRPSVCKNYKSERCINIREIIN